MKLSVLDQSIVPKGGSARQALLNTIEVAKQAERLGYFRFWVSEHHNMASIAGSAPEVLMGKLASETTRLRIGSGGIMLPNHSALKVAENFRLLEGLFPGRIDLGMGRAPGGNQLTASLLNPANDFSEESYLRQLDFLQRFFHDTADTQFGKVLAIPLVDTTPQQWILSSSGGSSRIAATRGMGLAVAKFINGNAEASLVETYQASFVPSEQFSRPEVLVSVIVLCADTEDKARQLRKTLDYQFLQMSRGRFEGISPYEAIKDYSFSSVELEHLKANAGRIVSGTQEQVKAELTGLANTFQADEVMATTMSYHFEDRLRSFELLAEAFGLSQPAAME